MNAELRSNDGESALIVRSQHEGEYAHEPGYECRVELITEHWDGDHTHPSRFEVDGIWIAKRDLITLRATIRDWIDLPLSKLKITELKAKFQLGNLPGQTFAIDFGPRADTISSGKPVVSCEIAAGVILTRSHFVTDQSCLGLFSEQLPR